MFAIAAVLGVVAVVALSMASKKAVDTLENATENKAVDPSNPDAQKEDQNAELGGSVKLSGYTTSVTAARFQQQISQFETDGYLVAEVDITNRDTKAQSFNYFDFKLQTPGGQVLDPDFSSLDGLLGSGDLIQGGNVTGKVVWTVGETKGTFIIIYKPDVFDAARGLWKVAI